MSRKERVVSEKIFDLVKGKYQEEIELIFEQIKGRMHDEEESFPIGIVSSKITVLEAVIKYLRENRGFSFRKIGEVLDRNEKNVWTTYSSAKKKMKKELEGNGLMIPFKIFTGKYSALEAVVVYLRDKGLSLNEIAKMIERDNRTVWTVYNRAKKK